MLFKTNYLSDTQLIDGIRAGGSQGRLQETILYNRYVSMVRSGIRKHRLSWDEGQNAYSDAVMAVIDQLQRNCFAGQSSLKTYLYTVFTHKCIDQLRSRLSPKNTLNHASTLDESLQTLPDSVRSIIDALIAQADAAQLQAQLRRLNRRSREIIQSWSEGYSDAEIAQRFNYRSAAVVKTTRLRSLKKLRELYQPAKR